MRHGREQPEGTRTGTYDERLSVPWRWWVIPAVFLGVLWLGYRSVLGEPAALLVTAAGAAVVAVTLARYGAARIRVADGLLTAGAARIPLSAIGEVQPLDAEQARQLRGPKADARAYLLLRGYLPRAVYVQIADPADPTPYAYLSTRHPERLAQALEAARSGP